MAQTMVNFLMDDDVKERFDKYCSGMGMSMGTVINILAMNAMGEHISVKLTADKKKQDVSRRIGIAKGELNVPKEFSEWDKEVQELFEDGETL